MAENMIKFLRGNVANLPANATAGAVYFTKDEGLYLGLEDGTYHRYGDFIEVANVDSLPADGAHIKAMYYCTAENILAKWNGTKWVQINKQQTLAELGGVAKSVYEAKIAALEKADTDNTAAIDGVDNRLKAAEKKLESVATTEGLADLAATVDGHTAAIGTINGTVETAGSMLYIAKAAADGKDAAIKEAKDAADAAQLAVDTLSGTHATDKKALEDAIALKAAADSVYTKTEIDNKVSTLEAADLAINNKIGTVAEGKTVAGLIKDAQDKADAAYVKPTDGIGAGDLSAGVQASLAKADSALQAADIENKADKATTLAGYGITDAYTKTEVNNALGLKVDQSAYDDQVAALEGEDARLAGLISDMDTAYKAADSGIISRVSTLETQITGLSGAMHFRGVKEDIPADVTGYVDGDVIIVGEKEYVFNDGSFVLFGDVSAEGDRISALEIIVGKYDEDGKPVDGLVKDVADNTAAIAAEKSRAEAKEAELATADATNLQAAKDYADAAVDALNIEEYAKQTALDGVAQELSTYKEAHKNDYDNDTIDSKVQGVQSQINALNDTYATDAELESAINTEIARANGAYAAKTLESTVSTHTADTVAHITADERTAWNGAVSDLSTHKAAYDNKVAALEAEDASIRAAFAAADAALKTELQGYADTAAEGVETALDTYKNSNDAAVALKANAADVYAKTETYTKSEVETLMTWGSF